MSELKLDPNIFLINDDMWWSKDDIAAYEYLRTYNKDFMQTVIPHLKGTEVAVQAGGHCGWMVREFNKHFKYTYTFEPNNISFLCLCMNLPGDNVFKFQACVGNEHKLVDMFKHPNQSGANYVDKLGRIPMLMIDDLGLNSCDFIQLDLEGYEYFALLGAVNTITKYKPLLCIERVWNARFGISFQTIDKLLSDLAYIHVGGIGSEDHLYKHI